MKADSLDQVRSIMLKDVRESLVKMRNEHAFRSQMIDQVIQAAATSNDLLEIDSALGELNGFESASHQVFLCALHTISNNIENMSAIIGDTDTARVEREKRRKERKGFWAWVRVQVKHIRDE